MEIGLALVESILMHVNTIWWQWLVLLLYILGTTLHQDQDKMSIVIPSPNPFPSLAKIYRWVKGLHTCAQGVKVGPSIYDPYMRKMA